MYVLHISDEESQTQLLDMDISPLSIHSVSSASSSSSSGGISDSGKNKLSQFSYDSLSRVLWLRAYSLHVILEILTYTHF